MWFLEGLRSFLRLSLSLEEKRIVIYLYLVWLLLLFFLYSSPQNKDRSTHLSNISLIPPPTLPVCVLLCVSFLVILFLFRIIESKKQRLIKRRRKRRIRLKFFLYIYLFLKSKIFFLTKQETRNNKKIPTITNKKHIFSL